MILANNHLADSINPPAVVPINQGLASAPCGMPPPPPPPLLGRRPDIRVPSATWEIMNNQSVALWNSCAVGPQNAFSYNPNHEIYAAEHNHWANCAYTTPLVEMITLSITALHETGKWGRQCGIPFGVSKYFTCKPVF